MSGMGCSFSVPNFLLSLPVRLLLLALLITRLQICPVYSKPQMVPTDLNISLQGLTLIQGQIYNPELGMISPYKCR